MMMLRRTRLPYLPGAPTGINEVTESSFRRDGFHDTHLSLCHGRGSLWINASLPQDANGCFALSISGGTIIGFGRRRLAENLLEGSIQRKSTLSTILNSRFPP
jgi:hypothetical protein